MTSILERAEFELPLGTIISGDAIYEAIGGQRTCRVFPSDHDLYRTWVMVGPKGSVTVHDAGNGWYQIELVETDSKEDELEFWTKLCALITDKPALSQEIIPGRITELLAQSGMLNGELLADF